jgi:hypothetical protein
MAEVQKQQALAQTQIQIEQAKSNFEIQRLQQELIIKKQLMAEEFNYKMQLATVEMQNQKQKVDDIENRKDKRIKMQGTQQSQLIDQRQNDSMPKDFESNFDNLSGLGTGLFE